MVYKTDEEEYNGPRIKIIEIDGKMFFKLYRDGKLIYIGEYDGVKRDDNDNGDERAGETGSDRHD